jgi:general secretion pathway protein N
MLSPSRLLALMLAGVCGVLVLILIAQQWLGGGGSDPGVIQVSPSGSGVPSSLETRQFDLPPKGDYAEVIARPLFSEDRRPEERDAESSEQEEAIAADVTQKELPPVRLTGVIITPEQRIAMLRNNKNREYVTLKEGEPLEGWTLEEIGQRRIVFATGGKREVVQLEVHTGGLGGGGRGKRGNADNNEQTRRGWGNGDQSGEGESDEPLSATEQIKQRIQRERERRRELIEEARKRQQNADSNQ